MILQRLQPDHLALANVMTPALIVDGAALQANIGRMARFAQSAGVALRPHVKTHKSSLIAAMQVAAGAIGIACATIAEVQAMRAAGIDDILLTSPLADPAKASMAVELHRHGKLSVVVDHPQHLAYLGAALQPEDQPLDILIDVDLGQMRTGVADIQAALALARDISASDCFRLRGLQGFGGHIQHIVNAAEREAAAIAAGIYLKRIIGAFRDEAMPCDIVSGSGTGSYAYDAGGPYTELQVGSYVFMDADYRRLQNGPAQASESGTSFGPALFVLATVVSANRPGQVTVDAGIKALAFNGPPPDILIGVPQGAGYRFAGDEHGIVTLPDGVSVPPVGSRILLAATHCDPTVNLHASYWFVGPDGRCKQVGIEARYR